MKRNVQPIIDELMTTMDGQEKLLRTSDSPLSEERKLYAKGRISGYLRCVLLLRAYTRGKRTLREVRAYLKTPFHGDTVYARGIAAAYHEVLGKLAPVPRQKRCDYCEDVLEPETARKNLCSGMYQPLCICCYEALEEMALRGETV